MGITRVGVAVTVFVGIGVEVADGIVCVCDGVAEVVGLPVGAGVNVGNDVGTKDVDVGKGAKVGKPNKEVGVPCVPSVGNKTALGIGVDVGRGRSKGIRVEQRQQITNSNKPGRRILTHCPCAR
jgi:hypothetical protein